MFSHLVRALECLGKKFKAGTQDLLEGADEETTEAVRSVLAGAKSHINAIAEGQPDIVADRLKKIGRKVSSAVSAQKTFGEVVETMLGQFGFPDANVLEAYYAQNPRSDNRNWPKLLTKIRGALIHEGYFRISDGTINLDDLVVVGKHSRDILVRTVLKALQYDGSYQPTVLIPTSPQIVDWVTPTTPAGRLGYGAVDEW